MEIIAHKINTIEGIKKCLGNPIIDGIEMDFQLCDNQIVNTHHFFKGFPGFHRNHNWLIDRSYESLRKLQETGEYRDLDEVLNLIGTDKKVLMDLKNWLWLKIFSSMYNNGNPYLNDQKKFAAIFLEEMDKYKDQNNILIQSFDYPLIAEIIKLSIKENVRNNFEYGLIVRNKKNEAATIPYIEDLPISFLSIKYSTLKKLGNVSIDREQKSPLKIYSWFDITDLIPSKSLKYTLSEKSNCTGIIL